MANAVNYLAQIQTGQTIQAVHVNQFVDALSGSAAYDLVTSGSYTIIGPLYATASWALNALNAKTADSGSKTYIASNASTNIDYTLVFKNDTGALNDYYQLAADGTNGPYYNPSTNVLGGLGGLTVSGSIGRFTSITGSLSGSITGTAASATSASYAVSSSYSAVSQQSNTFLGSIMASGSITTTPTPGLQIIAGASKTNGAGVANIMLNELGAKTLGVDCFITTAPIGTGVSAVSVATQAGATVIFQGDLNTDFSFMVVYF
jgi:hypothetical protein